MAHPTPEQLAAARQGHSSLTADQERHMRLAREDRRLRFDVNHGRPQVAATPRPGEFSGLGTVSAERAGSHSAHKGAGGENVRPSKRSNEMHGPEASQGHHHPAERTSPGQGGQPHGGPHPQKQGPHGAPHPQKESGMGEGHGPR